MVPPLLQHGFKLLLLGVVQHRLDLGFTVFHNLVGLGAAILLRKTRVGAQRLHLLCPVFEHWLDLCDLVVRQVKFFSQMLRHAIRVGCFVSAPFPVLRCLRCATGLGLIGRLCECHASSQHSAEQHRYRLCMHKSCDLL